MFRVEKFQTNKFSDLCFSWGKSKNMYERKFKHREEDRYCLAERDKLGETMYQVQERTWQKNFQKKNNNNKIKAHYNGQEEYMLVLQNECITQTPGD